jgi:hypothetical protein
MNSTRRERKAPARRIKADAPPVTIAPARRKSSLAIFLAFIIGSAVTFGISHYLHRDLAPPSQQREIAFHPALTLGRLMEMTPEELASVDIAEANLLCAQGLPGSENLNIKGKLRQFDDWVDRVDLETRRNFHRFKEHPAEYENSEIYYRMGMIVTVLQQDFGVHYNPDLMDVPEAKVDEAFLSNPSNMMLTGLLSDKRMGTCSSMPVLYAAIGRRLHYPVHLVSAKDHLFVRWELPGNAGHVNIEGTGRGFALQPDEHYTTSRAMTAAEINGGVHMKSLTPAQELAVFLMTRGGALQYHKRLAESAVAYAHAAVLWPENTDIKIYLAETAVKLAPWKFHSIPAMAPPLPVRSLSPAQAIEQTNRRILQETHPDVDWDLVYQKKPSTKQP